MNKLLFKVLVGIFLFAGVAGMQAQNSQVKEITLEDIWVNYKFYPRGVSGFTPMPDPALYSVQTKDGLIAKNFATGETVRGIVSGSELKNASGGKIGMKEIQMYKLNEQQDKLLIGTEVEYIYRRSYKAIYYVYDL
ncbi:MAG: DPP IV N-terminal domain-containing protein, partial [Bacteroidales bacterium]|nr:DPP IV N-terminal domain-containing protein [Bacteroidales bacterium]